MVVFKSAFEELSLFSLLSLSHTHSLSRVVLLTRAAKGVGVVAQNRKRRLWEQRRDSLFARRLFSTDSKTLNNINPKHKRVDDFIRGVIHT